MSGTDAQVAAGREALARGAWAEARASFEAALRGGERADALEGLGEACSLLGDGAAWRQAHERAYRLHRERGSARDAARLAFWMALAAHNVDADPPATHGWIDRGLRLLDGAGPTLEAAWLTGFAAHVALLVDHDPARARALCRETRELARSQGSADLEMLALGLEGLAMVTQGEVAEGMRRLDEATVAATSGEMSLPMAVENVCCYQIDACKRVRDFDRAGRWCLQVKDIARRWSDWQMFTTCRLHHADVLLSRGAWADAERELETAAAEVAGRGGGKAAGDAAVRLAELRRRQGLPGEAEELAGDASAHRLAPLVRGRIALERGDADLARDLAERALRRVGPDERTERVPGLALRAPAAVADGLLAADAGDLEAARRLQEDGVDLHDRAGAPYEAAQARAELARVLRALGRHAAAGDEARGRARAAQPRGRGRAPRGGRRERPHPP